MKKVRWPLLLLTLCLTIYRPSRASAWSYDIGDDGQWNGTHYELDKFEFFTITGGTFAAPPQTNFSLPGWGAILVNPHYSLATGPGAGSLSWTFNFAGAAGDPVTLDWLAYSDGMLVGAARVTLVNNSFSYVNLSSLDTSYDRTQAVPIASTLLLFASGLAGLGLLGRRCQKAPIPIQSRSISSGYLGPRFLSSPGRTPELRPVSHGDLRPQRRPTDQCVTAGFGIFLGKMQGQRQATQ